MKPGFILNCHDRARNPLFESHDPSMMWDASSGYYYSYSTDTAITSAYRQGIPIRRSRNLVDFDFVGYALSPEAIAEGRDNGRFPPTRGFWAPYVELCGGEYRMYYSATKAFGSSESRIWLAVSDSPKGPFENRGVVADTWGTPDTEPNAIDPHVFCDGGGRRQLVYGSFFGGIYMKELDSATGLAAHPDVKYQGKCIARKPPCSHVDGPEGAAVIYAEETGYYYLFLSYGWLGDDYDIRVGRSRSAAGPYVDFHGRSLEGRALGLKLAGSYRFSARKPCAVYGLESGPVCGGRPADGETGKGEDPKQERRTERARMEGPAGKSAEDWVFGGFRGPGHGVPFYDPVSDSYFFIHHVRDGASALKGKGSYLMHYMVVRRMYFVDGWPVFSPEPYAGESRDVCSLEEWEKSGNGRDGVWEWLEFLPSDNRQIAAAMGPLPADADKGRLLVFSCFDFENGRETYALSGLTEKGNVVWGKLWGPA